MASNVPWDLVLTTGQIAKICKVSPRTVSKWIDKGLLDGYRIPGSNDRRVRSESLRKFLKIQNMPVDFLDDYENSLCFRILCIGLDHRMWEVELSSLSDHHEYRVVNKPTLFGAAIAVHSTNPHVVVIDLGIGRSTCVEAAKRLAEYLPSTSLVAIIDSSDGPIAEATDLVCFDHVIESPFVPGTLSGKIMEIRKAFTTGTAGRPVKEKRTHVRQQSHNGNLVPRD